MPHDSGSVFSLETKRKHHLLQDERTLSGTRLDESASHQEFYGISDGVPGRPRVLPLPVLFPELDFAL